MLKKQQEEAQLYTIIKVALDKDLHEQIGRNIYFDLVDHDKVHSFRIKKLIPFNRFKEEVAKELGIPVQFQRFWLWAKRQNHTYRPHRLLTSEEEAQCVGQLREVSKKTNAKLKLFLELEIGQDLELHPPPAKSKEDILLFFKLYDPLIEELRYVGRLFVNAKGKPVEILTMLNKIAGFAPDEEITLFEEIRFEPSVMCEPVDIRFTFGGSQLEDGDIICYQKSSQVENSEQFRYPNIPSFLNYVRRCQENGFAGPENQGAEHAGHQHEFQLPFQENNVVNVVDVTGISREVNLLQPFRRDLAATEAPNVDEQGEQIPCESTPRMSCHRTPQAHTQQSVNAPTGKVRFLSYFVSSQASILLERIHGLHKDTFTKFSLKGSRMQTGVLESFASFIESMSTTKVNEVEALSQAVISIEDFELVGLDLLWLKQRLDEAKRVNKCSDSVVFMELCESALKAARARVCELEEGLSNAKAEVEDRSRDLPNSLGVDDYVLKDLV